MFAEFYDGLADFPGLLDPEDEGIKFLRSVDKCLPNDSASYLRNWYYLCQKFNVFYCLGSWAKAVRITVQLVSTFVCLVGLIFKHIWNGLSQHHEVQRQYKLG